MSRKNSAVLGLGSNLGRKSENLCQAIKYLEKFCDIEKVSPIYKTASLLKDDQDAYFNLCVSVTTDMEPVELLKSLKNIEKRMGRVNSGHWYTRVIDIDIVDFNSKVYEFDMLKIPHPHMPNRSFVLYPLRDIYPDYINPVSCLSIDNMVQILKDDLGIIKLGVAIWQL